METRSGWAFKLHRDKRIQWNNGRAAILNADADVFYTAGNAGNGSNPQPDGVILGAGAQLIQPEWEKEKNQDPGLPTPVASFNVTLLGGAADKIGKDDNFRGMTVFNNVLYYTKGSGGNGVNTVYFVVRSFVFPALCQEFRAQIRPDVCTPSNC